MRLKGIPPTATADLPASDLRSVEARIVGELCGVPRLSAVELQSLAAAASWRQVATAAGRRLWPLLAYRVRERGVRVPVDVLALFDGARRGNAIAWMRRRRALVEACAQLSAAGVDVTVLKGMALAAVVYPSPELRTMSDMDIWVHAPTAEPLPELLASLGWREGHWRANGIVDRRLTAGLALGDPPLVLEAHVAPGSLAETVPELLASMRDRRTVAAEWPVLAPGDQLLHAMAHAAVHHRFNGVLPGVLDVALLVSHARERIDWPAWGAECRVHGAERFAAASLAASARLFGAPVPESAWRALDVADAHALGLAAAEGLWWAHVTGENPEAVLSARGVGGVARATRAQVARVLRDHNAGRPGAAGRLFSRVWTFARYIAPRHLASLARGDRFGPAGAMRRSVRERHEALMRTLAPRTGVDRDASYVAGSWPVSDKT